MIAWDQLEGDLRRSLRRPGVPDHVVDDLVQEAAERLLAALPRLRDDQRVGPYVGRVVRSVWVDHLRRRRPTTTLDEATLAAAAPEGQDLAPEVATWLPALIDTLPPRDRQILRLVELEGMRQRHAAEVLGLSPSGARTRVQRGRQRLRQALEACCEVERQGARIAAVTPRGDARCTCDD